MKCLFYLYQTHKDQREHELLKKKEETRAATASESKKKPKKELEEDLRIEGLQKSIDSSNKGFAMLQKMGYKAGEKLFFESPFFLIFNAPRIKSYH